MRKGKNTHLKAEFQRIAGEIRKPSSVFNEKKQRKTIQWERLDLFKKIRATKGTLQAKMGTIKDRNGMDLTEAEDIKRDGKNTQNYTEKVFMTQIITMV